MTATTDLTTVPRHGPGGRGALRLETVGRSRPRRAGPSTSTPPGRVPVGRREQRARLATVMDGARSGRGGAVVVRGNRGTGKTHLLEEAITHGADFVVLRAAGVEVESGIPFGTLQQLCGPLADRTADLPPPQAAALAAALGLAPEVEADPTLVGLGVVSVLAGMASESGRPVLCVLDDAEWIDASSAQAIGVAARRMVGVEVALLLSAGGTRPIAALEGLDEVRLQRLTPGEADLMLSLELPARLEAEVRQRILAEADGNPRVIRRLGQAMAVPALAGGFAVDAVAEVDADLDLEVTACLAELPDDVATALLVAAAEPLGDVAAFRKGCSAEGLTAAVERAVEATGLVEIGDRVVFRHPLVRHLVYRQASEGQRRDAHRVVAASLELSSRDAHVAWHRGLSGAGPDEEVAQMLEQWSRSAGRTGGVAAAAAFMERAALRSANPHAQVRRAIEAARLHSRSGGFDDALRMIAEIEHRDSDSTARALAHLLAAEIGAWTGKPDAACDLLDAAARIATVEPERLPMPCLTAFDTVTSAGRFGAAGDLRHVAARAGLLTSYDGGAPAERLLQASVSRWGSAAVARRDTLARSIDAWCADESAAHPFATVMAMDLLDEKAWVTLARRDVDHARQTGALAGLPRALDLLACLHLWRGEIDGTAAATEESARLARLIGAGAPELAPTLLRSWQGSSGDDPDCADVSAKPLADLGRSLVHIASGRYEPALRDAQRALDANEPFVSSWAAPQVVEAAVRVGDPEQAATAIALIRSVGRATGSAWALGLEQRCLALVADDHGAEQHFRESVRQLELSGMRLDLGRTHLLYGEWLRRQTRRVDSRTPLREALEVFDAAGATAFAKRAWLELRASGEQARRRAPETLGALTERESQIVELAIEGHSNPAIGKQLFISSRTVEYHLNKVFSKVGITSRAQLRVALER
ncbi:helix-turn-helix transcriptional regulator [Aeromicrobium wangtongii]|uniref:helix-turn-helix transcriptional regulator n=1 Tax=Aeromicrobium wangtongii TaxID=2969247 RepID=UPI00201712D5|nr:LuxR family transcriptional regulator [Aeromicrobium wangtongii]MCL3819355.1 AAA family ATPase [Aeromicrobium wangtongii]